jgi:hypothetical protein
MSSGFEMTAMQPLLPFLNGGKLEVHLSATNLAVLDFTFAAIKVVRFLADKDFRQHNAGMSV